MARPGVRRCSRWVRSVRRRAAVASHPGEAGRCGGAVVARIAAGGDADGFQRRRAGSVRNQVGSGWLPDWCHRGEGDAAGWSERSRFRTNVLLERVYYILPGCQGCVRTPVHDTVLPRSTSGSWRSSRPWPVSDQSLPGRSLERYREAAPVFPDAVSSAPEARLDASRDRCCWCR